MRTVAFVAIATAVTLALVWLAFVLLLGLLRPRGMDLAEAKRLVPDVLRLVRDLAKDPSLPWTIRARLLVLLAYLVSPLDLVPDFIPVLGYADDVVVIAVVLRSVIRRAGSASLDEHWRGTPHGLAIIRRIAGVA